MNNPTIPQNELLKHRWGWSRYLYVGEETALAIAWGKKGGASSLHYHHGKHNSFLVLAGEVRIDQRDDAQVSEGAPILPRLLTVGQCLTVPATQDHRMVFLEDSVLHEIYQALPYMLIDLDDITRFDDGWEPGRGPSGRLGST